MSIGYSDVISTISLIATITGLVFVIVSLRQTRQSINASTYQHILDREAANWDKVRASDIATRIQALRNFGINVREEDYGSKEEILLDHIAVFNFYEGIYFQKIQGVLNEEVLENWEHSLKHIMNNSEFKENWNNVGHVYSSGFSKYVESLIAEN